MNDLFLSHSGYDKDTIVIPLAEALEAMGITIWFDTEKMPYSIDVKSIIADGIHHSLLYVVIITENFFKSNWANYELASKLEGLDTENVMPIILNMGLDKIAEKYPFLLNYRYLKTENDINYIAQAIFTTLNEIKESHGYHYIEKTNLNNLAKKLHTYNNAKLDAIAIKIRSTHRNLTSSPLIAINTLCLTLEIIAKDIASLENVYTNGRNDLTELMKLSRLLPENALEHMKYLFSLREFLANNPKTRLEQDDLYLAELSISSVIEYYIATYFRLPLIRNVSLEVIAPDDITDVDMIEVYEIEKLVLPPELIAGPEMTKLWHNHNAFTLIGVRDTSTKRLVGFLHTLPVTEPLFKQICEGNFDDTVIDIAEIRQYDMPGTYKLYISSLCVHPQYNSTTTFKLLYTSFIDLLLVLAENHEIFITDIVADGATVKGTSLCETIGMKMLSHSNHNTPVYHASLIPPDIATIKLKNRQGRQLLQCYERIYQEYKDLF